MQSPVVETSRARATRRRLALCATTTLILLALVSCWPGGRKSAEKTQYAIDVENVCHAEERSGALDQDPSMRSMKVANWLASTLVTEDSRALLGRLAGLAPEEKAALLAGEADKLGVAPCPMVGVWSGQ